RKLEDTFQENSNWLKLLDSYEDSPAGVFDEAQPVNVPTSFKQRAMLVDEISHAAGDNASDIDWYAKRTVLAGIYSTTEIYMLTDTSPDFHDSWAFLDARKKKALSLLANVVIPCFFIVMSLV
ncbi:hypothetical protein S83_070344, partial [Arachis hypogaea]